jgi:TRAP-type C4-dicarboxylate transport system permease small subunit
MKLIYFVSRYAGYAANSVLGLMMVLTVVDVFLRFFFSAPLTGTTELTEFMLIIVIFPALAWCALRRKHVRVDLVMSQFRQRTQAVVDTITMLITLVVFGIITWQSFLEAREVTTKSSLLLLPDSPFYWVLTFGFALFCLAILTILVETIAKEVKR